MTTEDRNGLIERRLVGSSTAIRRLRADIADIARSDLPILIEGPTGSGKELVAAAIHDASGRPGAQVAINVCAIADSMFEDSLFGHVKGAFTGAVADAPGVLLEAHRGTLFLDEISGLATPNQAKLLRAIETRQFRPVGGRSDRVSDFRVVAATNERLDLMIAQSRFRADLAHRLRGFVLRIPSLADRACDIPELIDYFLKALPTRRQAFDSDAVRLLQGYAWPGNVRQLRLVVERISAIISSATIRREDVLRAAPELDDAYIPERTAFAERHLFEVLEDCEWDVDLAASRLGVHRATVYRRLRRMRGGQSLAIDSRNLSRDVRIEAAHRGDEVRALARQRNII